MKLEDKILSSLTVIEAKVTDIRGELGATKREVSELNWRIEGFGKLHGALGLEVTVLRQRVDRLEAATQGSTEPSTLLLP
jgi:hypothetical protein